MPPDGEENDDVVVDDDEGVANEEDAVAKLSSLDVVEVATVVAVAPATLGASIFEISLVSRCFK